MPRHRTRTANLSDLDGFVVEWPGQRTPVSSGRYEWPVPIELRAGTVEVLLRDREGRGGFSSVDSRSIPFRRSRSPRRRRTAFELPADGEIGQTAVIRGSSDGKLSSKAVSVGASRRRCWPRLHDDSRSAFRRRLPGRSRSVSPPARSWSSGRCAFSRFGVSASPTQLFRGQRATLTRHRPRTGRHHGADDAVRGQPIACRRAGRGHRQTRHHHAFASPARRDVRDDTTARRRPAWPVPDHGQRQQAAEPPSSTSCAARPAR